MKYKFRKKVIVLDILLGVFFLAGLITSVIVLKGSFFNYLSTAISDIFTYAFGFTNIYFSICAIVGLVGLVVALLWLILSLCRRRWFSIIPSVLYGIVALFFASIGAGFIASTVNWMIAGTIPDLTTMIEMLISGGLYLVALIFGFIFFFIEVCSKRPLKENAAPLAEVTAPIEEEKSEEIKEEPTEEVKPEEKPEEVKEEKPDEAKKVSEALKKEEEAAPIRKTRTISKAEIAEAEKKDVRKTQTIILKNEDGASYAKALHVSRRPELNKWQVKATGSEKALKLFDTQKEAIEYAEEVAKRQNISVRVHSRGGKIRKA